MTFPNQLNIKDPFAGRSGCFAVTVGRKIINNNKNKNRRLFKFLSRFLITCLCGFSVKRVIVWDKVESGHNQIMNQVGFFKPWWHRLLTLCERTGSCSRCNPIHFCMCPCFCLCRHHHSPGKDNIYLSFAKWTKVTILTLDFITQVLLF